MATVIYTSADAGAPVLTGQSGSLTALIKACLVTGYGAQPAAGWTNPISGAAGQEIFRQGGGGFYWQVDDTGPGLATFKEARTRGFETMTAWNTGTGLFPTVAQIAAGIIVRKSATADGTARPWVVAADDRTAYLFLQTGDVAGNYSGTMFGDIFSVLAGDAYKCAIIGRGAENDPVMTVVSDSLGRLTALANTNAANHYIARTYTGFGAAVLCDKLGDAGVVAGVQQMFGVIAFPNPADGGLYLAPIVFKEGSSNVHLRRGRLRGLWHQCHPIASFSDRDTFDGAGELAGRSFLLLKTAATTGIFTVETTDWDTSP